MRCFVLIGTFCLALVSFVPSARAGDDPDGRDLLQEAQKQVAAYHANQEASQHVLRVVYFTPKDREPLADHAARLGRIMDDISEFYRDGLKRFGIESAGLPLEKKDGSLVIHLVRGRMPASEYHHESGNVTRAEIREALRGTIDLEREHVLVLYSLCTREPDGRYIFDAPYYGMGGSCQRWGFCHAADCEVLDAGLLTAKDKPMVFTEHYYPRKEMSVAQFNSMYLGGIAHELGHGLGLPHDSGGPAEQAFGVSLMGAGNLNYREDRWGGRRPAFFSRTSALQLISHPLITRSDRGRWETSDASFQDLEFYERDGATAIKGGVGGPVPAYAVVASIWKSTDRTDHKAISFPILVRGGKFDLALPAMARGNYRLRLCSMHVNGATAEQELPLRIGANGKCDPLGLQAEWVVGRAEQALLRHDEKGARELLESKRIAAAPTPEAKRKLELLRSLLDPAEPVDLQTTGDDKVYLSDSAWTEAGVGWGKPARNHFWFGKENRGGILLNMGERFVDKALFAHSPSKFVFPVGRKWKSFTATVGLCDGTLYFGAASFTVKGDGKELFRSRVLKDGGSQRVEIDISQVENLELITEVVEGSAMAPWALWADPQVRR
jgi:hypothetical protein